MVIPHYQQLSLQCTFRERGRCCRDSPVLLRQRRGCKRLLYLLNAKLSEALFSLCQSTLYRLRGESCGYGAGVYISCIAFQKRFKLSEQQQQRTAT